MPYVIKMIFNLTETGQQSQNFRYKPLIYRTEARFMQGFLRMQDISNIIC
ncbi:hypothetical protein CAL7102_03262 [Dulcicalothrix desertica PCC 7102]|nr:hypothetical protein CAL7102_03262 [Dulcicalothrix desertica PCC 7102]